MVTLRPRHTAPAPTRTDPDPAQSDNVSVFEQWRQVRRTGNAVRHEFGPGRDKNGRVARVRCNTDSPCPGPQRRLTGKTYGARHALPTADHQDMPEIALVRAARPGFQSGCELQVVNQR